MARPALWWLTLAWKSSLREVFPFPISHPAKKMDAYYPILRKVKAFLLIIQHKEIDNSHDKKGFLIYKAGGKENSKHELN